MITTGDIENGLWTIAKGVSTKVYIDNRPKVLSAVSDYVVCGIATDVSSLVDNTNGSIAGTNVFFELYAKDIDDNGTKNSKKLKELEDKLYEAIKLGLSGYYLRHRGTRPNPYTSDGFHSSLTIYEIIVTQ